MHNSHSKLGISILATLFECLIARQPSDNHPKRSHTHRFVCRSRVCQLDPSLAPWPHFVSYPARQCFHGEEHHKVRRSRLRPTSEPACGRVRQVIFNLLKRSSEVAGFPARTVNHGLDLATHHLGSSAHVPHHNSLLDLVEDGPYDPPQEPRHTLGHDGEDEDIDEVGHERSLAEMGVVQVGHFWAGNLLLSRDDWCLGWAESSLGVVFLQ